MSTVMSKPKKPKAPEVEKAAKEKQPILFVRMPDYLEEALQAFRASQIVPPDRSAVAIAALEDFFRKHGHLPAVAPPSRKSS